MESLISQTSNKIARQHQKLMRKCNYDSIHLSGLIPRVLPEKLALRYTILVQMLFS